VNQYTTTTKKSNSTGDAESEAGSVIAHGLFILTNKKPRAGAASHARGTNRRKIMNTRRILAHQHIYKRPTQRAEAAAHRLEIVIYAMVLTAAVINLAQMLAVLP